MESMDSRDYQNDFFSITQGVFLCPPAARADGVAKAGEAARSDFPILEDAEINVGAAKLRQELFEKTLHEFDESFAESITQIYEPLIQSTRKYLFTDSSQKPRYQPVLDCAFLSRCSTEVASEITKNFTSQQILSETKYSEAWIIPLVPRDSQKLSSLVRSIMDFTLLRLADRIDSSTRYYSNLKRAATHADIDVLSSLYRAFCHDQLDQKSTKNPLIVLSLARLEAFDLSTLTDLCLLLQQRPELPVKLVCYSTLPSQMAIKQFPKRILEILDIHSFEAPNLECIFSELCQNLFVSGGFHLRLGPNAFAFMRSQFTYHDLSLGRFKLTLKYALFHHFLTNPLSIFSTSCTFDANAKDYLKRTLDFMQSQPSFKAFIRSIDKAAYIYDLLADKDNALSRLSELVSESRRIHRARSALGLQLRQVLAHLLQSKINLDLIKLVHSTDTLIEHDAGEVKRSIQIADDGKAQEVIKSVGRIVQSNELSLDATSKTLILELRNLISGSQESRTSVPGEKVQTLKPKRLALDGNKSPADDFSGLARSKSKRGAKRPLEHENDVPTNNPFLTAPSEHENHRQRLADCIYRLLRHLLQGPTDLPCHEAFFYDSDEILMNAFSFSTRSTILDALAKPEIYMNLTSHGEDEDNCADQTLPDITILFRQSLEAGKVLNLHDWFLAYSSTRVREAKSSSASIIDDHSTSAADQITQHESGKMVKGPISNPFLTDQSSQVRFARGVAELRYMGMLKDTQRKVQHLEKLIF